MTRAVPTSVRAESRGISQQWPPRHGNAEAGDVRVGVERTAGRSVTFVACAGYGIDGPQPENRARLTASACNGASHLRMGRRGPAMGASVRSQGRKLRCFRCLRLTLGHGRVSSEGPCARKLRAPVTARRICRMGRRRLAMGAQCSEERKRSSPSLLARGATAWTDVIRRAVRPYGQASATARRICCIRRACV